MPNRRCSRGGEKIYKNSNIYFSGQRPNDFAMWQMINLYFLVRQQLMLTKYAFFCVSSAFICLDSTLFASFDTASFVFLSILLFICYVLLSSTIPEFFLLKMWMKGVFGLSLAPLNAYELSAAHLFKEVASEIYREQWKTSISLLHLVYWMIYVFSHN